MRRTWSLLWLATFCRSAAAEVLPTQERSAQVSSFLQSSLGESALDLCIPAESCVCQKGFSAARS